jgi:hypothetical protein
VCVRVCKREKKREKERVCVSVCVSVCERENACGCGQSASAAQSTALPPLPGGLSQSSVTIKLYIMETLVTDEGSYVRLIDVCITQPSASAARSLALPPERGWSIHLRILKYTCPFIFVHLSILGDIRLLVGPR